MKRFKNFLEDEEVGIDTDLVVDAVEEEGVRRAREAIDQADLVLFVIDDVAPQTNQNHVSVMPEAN